MKKYALKNKKTNKIENVVMIDKLEDFDPGEDFDLIEDEAAEIGYAVDGDKVIVPEPEPIPEPDYRELRRGEYPSIADQLDVIWKQIEALKNGGISLTEEASNMLGEINKIKKKYKKA